MSAQSIQVGQHDYIGDVSSAIITMVNTNDPMFAQFSANLWRDLAVTMCAVLGIKIMLRGIESAAGEVMHFLVLLLITKAFLHYYSSPLPWGGVSVRQFFPEVGKELASYINISILDRLNTGLNNAIANTPQPGFMQMTETASYWSALFLTSCLQSIMFCFTSIGFVLSGVAGLLGRLFIPWLMVPRLSFLFWGWLTSMIKVSFYQVVGAGLTFIWATVWMNFLTTKIGTNYSLAHWHDLIAPMIVLNLAMVVSAPLVVLMCEGLFTGGGTAGAGFASTVVSTVSRRFR